jgi:prepilin-type N-terminal cleavage/methylation domain-containing protein
MKQGNQNLMQRGFTLVELLIVAIILAILAAIVVPQFASTTTDAQESALRANLSGFRGAIALYRQQHGEYPAISTAVPAGACSGTAGSGAASTRVAFVSQLTLYTNAAGEACSTPEAGAYPFGPYVDGDDLPDNPMTLDGTLLFNATGDLAMGGTAADLGWRFDTVSGKFIANDTSNDSQGNPYDEY